MSPAKRLGLFQTGDLIIVREGAATLRVRPQVMLSRAGDEGGTAPRSRRVLRSLIAVRKRGVKE